MHSQRPFHLIFITAQPDHARRVAAAGVDRVMVDLEMIGKEARQGHLNTVISGHQMQDVAPVARALQGSGAQVMVRVNPLHPGTRAEVDQAIANGADRLMLPMFRSPEDVAYFLGVVGGRVPVTFLLETGTALARLPQILEVQGDYDLHIGLNDLHLELGLDFMFEPLMGHILDDLAQQCHAAGRAFGIGGVAPLQAPVALPARLVLGEYARLGAAGTILSRAFRPVVEGTQQILHNEVQGVRVCMQDMGVRGDAVRDADRADFVDIVHTIASQMRKTA